MSQHDAILNILYNQPLNRLCWRGSGSIDVGAVGAVKDARFVEQEMHRVGWEFRRGIGSNIAQARNSIGPEGERSDGD